MGVREVVVSELADGVPSAGYAPIDGADSRDEKNPDGMLASPNGSRSHPSMHLGADRERGNTTKWTKNMNDTETKDY